MCVNILYKYISILSNVFIMSPRSNFSFGSQTLFLSFLISPIFFPFEKLNCRGHFLKVLIHVKIYKPPNEGLVLYNKVRISWKWIKGLMDRGSIFVSGIYPTLQQNYVILRYQNLRPRTEKSLNSMYYEPWYADLLIPGRWYAKSKTHKWFGPKMISSDFGAHIIAAVYKSNSFQIMLTNRSNIKSCINKVISKEKAMYK